MALSLRSPLQSQNKATQAILEYSHRFGYPLSVEEVWYWQQYSRHSKKYFSGWRYHSDNLLYLPGYKHLVKLRRNREKYSHKKLHIARDTAGILKRIPFVEGVFVTGSLSMMNCPKNDDIDLMIIARTDTVWICRPLVVFVLKMLGRRRDFQLPEHSSSRVSDKICDNLYLDTKHLNISHHPQNKERTLYLAHEILQAKPILNKNDVHLQFIKANLWVRGILPVAGDHILGSSSATSSSQPKERNVFLRLLNILFFLVQYIYMRKSMQNETVGIGYAYFHPRKNSNYANI